MTYNALNNTINFAKPKRNTKVIKITKLQSGGFTVEVVVKGQTVRTFECATLEETKSIE